MIRLRGLAVEVGEKPRSFRAAFGRRVGRRPAGFKSVVDPEQIVRVELVAIHPALDVARSLDLDAVALFAGIDRPQPGEEIVPSPLGERVRVRALEIPQRFQLTAQLVGDLGLLAGGLHSARQIELETSHELGQQLALERPLVG